MNEMFESNIHRLANNLNNKITETKNICFSKLEMNFNNNSGLFENEIIMKNSFKILPKSSVFFQKII